MKNLQSNYSNYVIFDECISKILYIYIFIYIYIYIYIYMNYLTCSIMTTHLNNTQIKNH